MSARGRISTGLGLALLVLTGCPQAGSQYVWSDDLEGPLCAGAPCGWEQIAGPEGAARWVESLAGEHGVSVRGDAVVLVVRPELELPGGALESTIAIEVIARCDAGSSLTMLVEATGLGVPLFFSPRVNFLSDWFEPRATAPQLGGGASPVSSIDAIRFTKFGEGSCEIDFVGVIDATFRF